MIFASLVGGGAISQMYYADRVIDLPFALIAVAISTTLLPYLSKNIDDEKKCFKDKEGKADFGISNTSSRCPISSSVASLICLFISSTIRDLRKSFVKFIISP